MLSQLHGSVPPWIKEDREYQHHGTDYETTQHRSSEDPGLAHGGTTL